jgi:hypothetical protein
MTADQLRAGRTAGAVPDRRGDGLERRWHGDARRDPPNIIVASRSGLSFNHFLSVLAPLVLVVLVLLCRIMFRTAFRYDTARVARVMALNERDAIRDPRLVAISRAVLGAVLVEFGLHTVLGLGRRAATPPQSGRRLLNRPGSAGLRCRASRRVARPG